MSMHFGRAWIGHRIEDACPCPKAPCGLAVPDGMKPGSCEQHNPADVLSVKGMRQIHTDETCPGQEAFERTIGTAYRDPDIRRMIWRLRRATKITDGMVESLAAAVHGRTPVAGNPVPWREDGDITRGVRWNEDRRNDARAEARRVLEVGLSGLDEEFG
jgi:hypothetical protein